MVVYEIIGMVIVAVLLAAGVGWVLDNIRLRRGRR